MNQELNLPIEQLNKYLELLQLRNELLARNPNLIEIQERIDRTLSKVGDNPIERCEVIQQIMVQSAYQLGAKVKDLIDYVEKCNLPLQVKQLVKEISDEKSV